MLNIKDKQEFTKTVKELFCRKQAGKIMKYAGVFLLFLISAILYAGGGKATDTDRISTGDAGSRNAPDGIYGAEEVPVNDNEVESTEKDGNEGGTGENDTASAGQGKEAGETGAGSTEKADPENDVAAMTIFVHVCGAVAKPGVYSAASGTRVYQVIEMAGGITGDGAGDALNQAEAVTDGQRIEVPTHEQVASGSIASPPVSTGTGSGENAGTGKAVVNINDADAELLSTLPGIGEAKALSIISYREKNGRFSTIDEIKNIEGIKEGLFNKIKDYISIN